ncbi:MAG: MarR family transcriptional regulator [Treponema sp.]|jgi:DNA-binding MarR family transcriptional regulator|nr:MarR family transcriptional regulator [Treponema sp.]
MGRLQEIHKQVHAYAVLWKKITAIYDAYAKAHGLSYAALHILYVLHNNPEGCTQKSICQRVFMPKQTVNSVIKELEAKGSIVCAVMEGDRRNKIVRLTDGGIKYASEIIMPIYEHEFHAMEQLAPEQREALLNSTERYAEYFSALTDG